jgi:cell division transport system permease protein
MLGLLGLLIINARKISDLVKENISFTIVLKENIKEADIRGLQKDLDASGYVKSSEYIDKERAAKEFQQELGDDFESFLGFNPLQSTIEVKLIASYANPDSISVIEKELQKNTQVSEVYYQKSLVHLVNENVKKISLILLIFSGLLFIIAISLINNTIRLSVYAKRFLINTMQLVGATSSFIRRPFLYICIIHGIIGATIAISLLVAFLFWAEKQVQDIIVLTDFYSIFALCTGLLFLGIIINVISTFFAVTKFLRLQTDDLYY